MFITVLCPRKKKVCVFRTLSLVADIGDSVKDLLVSPTATIFSFICHNNIKKKKKKKYAHSEDTHAYTRTL